MNVKKEKMSNESTRLTKNEMGVVLNFLGAKFLEKNATNASGGVVPALTVVFFSSKFQF